MEKTKTKKTTSYLEKFLIESAAHPLKNFHKDLWLSATSIASKYTEEEIRKMIEDGGGYVNRSIFA